MMADVIPMPIPTAPSGAMQTPLPPGQPPPQQIQIQLPPQLQDVMQQFPSVLTRLKILEDKPVSASPTKLVAAVAFLSGIGLFALATFLWHYGAVLFRV